MKKINEIDRKDGKIRMTKRFSTLLVLSLTLMICASAMGAPRLTMPESTFNFGFVPQHAKISYGFWLFSTGDDTLKIVKVVPG